MIIVPLWDTALAVAEVHRCADKGAKAIAFSENVHALGFPSIHSGEWDGFFAAANETKMPLCTHIGSSSVSPNTSPDAPFGVQSVNIGLNLAHSTTDWLFSGKLQKFPDLKIVLSEGGIGWIPYLLERAEHVAAEYRYLRANNWAVDPATMRMSAIATDPAVFPESPRQLFRDHIYGCFIEDEFGAANLDYIGVENVMIETDYPHTDSLCRTHSRPRTRASRVDQTRTSTKCCKAMRGASSTSSLLRTQSPSSDSREGGETPWRSANTRTSSTADGPVRTPANKSM
jgi:hypothetical protein